MVWQPPGHIPGFHAPGTLTPIGWIFEQQAIAARAAAEAQAREVAELEAAALWFAATTPATCDFSQCGSAGAGRCRHCRRVFCRAHRSAYPATADACGDCQGRLRREAAQAEESRRRAEREAMERLESEHARKVADREARLGWAAAQQRVQWLEQQLARLRWIEPASAAAAFGAVLSLAAVLIFTVVTIHGLAGSDPQRALVGYAGTLAFLVQAPRAARHAWNRYRQQLRATYEKERRELFARKGCGARAGCHWCQPEPPLLPYESRVVAMLSARAAAIWEGIAFAVVFIAATVGEWILWYMIYVPNANEATRAVGIISGLLYLALAVVLPVASGVLAGRTVTRLVLARRQQVVSQLNRDSAFGWKSIAAGIIVMAIAGYCAWAPAIPVS